MCNDPSIVFLEIQHVWWEGSTWKTVVYKSEKIFLKFDIIIIHDDMYIIIIIIIRIIIFFYILLL